MIGLCKRSGISDGSRLDLPEHYGLGSRTPSHYKDWLSMYMGPSYLYNGNSYTGKTASLYHDAPQKTSTVALPVCSLRPTTQYRRSDREPVSATKDLGYGGQGPRVHSYCMNGSTPSEMRLSPRPTVTLHYNDVTMDAIASQITSRMIVYSAVYSDADQRKHRSSASPAFVRGIHRWPVNSPHKWPVTRKKFAFDDVIMFQALL